MAGQGALRLESLTKRYGELHAVDDVSLDVRPGEFLTLLGPSGSGKTTTLKIVAGFAEADSGRVILDDRDLTRVPPYRRDVGMVFQNYALFPHMTAGQNVAFPLEMRRVPRDEVRRRTESALERMHLGGLRDRYPRQLSGGQQQRVAVARALVYEPRLLLMDEPLGALDKKLRESLQLELMHLSRELAVTVLYVTHDQDEALVMSDRIAVYRDGRIQQLGTGEELYERPVSRFVAEFVGESNLFAGSIAPDGPVVEHEGGPVRVTEAELRRSGLRAGEAALVLVRPERVQLLPQDAPPPEDAATVLPGRIREAIYMGTVRKVAVTLADGRTVTARLPSNDERGLPASGEVRVTWPTRDGILVHSEPHAPEIDEAASGEADVS
jgi:putative spermidine/putrescine transport system ATP-binding protein